MRKLLHIVIGLLMLACAPEDEMRPVGNLQFSGLEVMDFSSQSPNARQNQNSDWVHVLPDFAEITIVNTNTGNEYLLPFDPSDFSTPYGVELPFGEYTFSCNVEAGIFEDYLSFESNGAFVVDGNPVNIVLEAFTEYGLVTIKNEYLENAEISAGGETKELKRSSDRNHFYQYVEGGRDVVLEITEYFDQEVITSEFTMEAYNHFHFYLDLPDQGNANFQLVLAEFELLVESLPTSPVVEGVVRDAEGNVYKVVKIGNQYWMAENLRTSTFCNGDPLEEAGQPNWEWEYGNDIPGSWSFDNQPEYDVPYGKLYNNRAAVDERNICPCGYKIPSLEDWRELREYLGGNEEAAIKMRSTDPRYWIEELHQTATNESQFNALGAGVVWLDLFGYNFPSYFGRFNEMTTWWTSTVEERDEPWFPYDIVHSVWLQQTFYDSGTDSPDNIFLRSVRCIRE
ncbi:fibrobacter succinogenes major paralogous domain-containing protein [Litoribacter populi]|uniref:fibrobacter succinogenes major paralogous domain-containing protein n=1 Tax=Litoribacter populi TaxID=2598460 RepID=UPI00117E0398|nr:fibrobacter succinogenes major paralogous domain-containing protein [Litoribacter populi]